MNLRLLLPSVLVLLLCSSAGAASYDVDNASMLANFYDGSNLWLATSFLKQPATWDYITTIIGKLAEGGIVLGIGFFLCEAARAYLSGESLELHEAFAFYGKALLIFCILALAVTSGSAFANFISAIFFAPIEAMTGIVKSGSTATILKQIADSLADAAAANQDSKLKWFMKLVELDVTMLMVNFFMMFALVIAWIMSLYIGIMTAMLLALGPICIPFFIFQPVSSVGWNWVKSMIAYPMMGVVGSIVTGMLMSSGMLKFAVDSGAMGQNLTSIASSVILIIVMISIPGVTSALFGGIVGSPMGAARTLTSAASTAVTAGAAAVGGALAVGGPAAAKVGGAMSSMSEGTSGVTSTVGGAIKSVGERAAPLGRSILQSQFPGLSRIKRSMESGSGTNSAFGTLADQQSSMVDYASRTFGHQVASTMQDRMSLPAYSGFGVTALEGESKAQSIERSARTALSSMGIRPGTASTLGMADRKVGADGFDFGFNSREANQALMADWVRKNYGLEEFRSFKEGIAGTSHDLAGVSKDIQGTVGEGAESAAASMGVTLDFSKAAAAMAPEDQHRAMVAYAARTYGANTGNLFAGKLQGEFAGEGIQPGTGKAYKDVMANTVEPLMQRMQLNIPVATSLDGAARKATNQGFNFNTNTLAGNQAIMVDWVRREHGYAASQRFAQDLKQTKHTIEGIHPNVVEAAGAAFYAAAQDMYPEDFPRENRGGGGGSQAGGPAADAKPSKDWRAEIDGWSQDKQSQNMVSFVKGRYGQATAEAFEAKLRSPEWAGTTIDTSKAEGTSYDAVMSPFMYSLMERMGAKPVVAGSMEELEGKNRGNGWNFSMNSREGNAALMTDYVRTTVGEQEAKRFADMIDTNKDYLAGRHMNLSQAVGAAVYDVYAGAGESAPVTREAPKPVSQPVASAPEPDRSNYRGQDVFTMGTDVQPSDYHTWDRSQQVGYMRDIARTANNGQYAQYADQVKVPDRWNPVVREGQAFHQAALGAMRELMRRQGFIGNPKKENP